jgi:hypothetical protein
MFITNHVLAGALAGSAFRRRPVLAFAAGCATHVLMDLAPHWGDASLDEDGFYAVARRDGLLGLAAVGVIAVAGVPPRAALLAGIAGAAALDADKPCAYLLGVNPFPGWLNRFHTRIQHEAPDRIPLEVGVGGLLAAACAVVLARRRGYLKWARGGGVAP